MSKNCPECGCKLQEAGYAHMPNCPLLDLGSAKYWMKVNNNRAEMFAGRMIIFLRSSQQWEGKFRIVKHENNQLRKKLSP